MSQISTKDALAFQVHRALLMAERTEPSLRDNPYWTMLKQDAYERFALAFERAK